MKCGLLILVCLLIHIQKPDQDYQTISTFYFDFFFAEYDRKVVELLGRESDAIAEKIDAEVRKIVDESYAQAKSILKKYRKELDAVAEKLLEAESITREEFEAIFPPPIDKKSGTPQPA